MFVSRKVQGLIVYNQVSKHNWFL